MPPRRLSQSTVLVLGTILAGLAVRFAPLGLPTPVSKYGGSFLWALLIYWLVSALQPRLHPRYAALVAGTLATAVEFFKLVHTPALNAFRLTLPGILLLGRFFSLWDLLAYGLAITFGALLDGTLRRLKPRTESTGV